MISDPKFRWDVKKLAQKECDIVGPTGTRTHFDSIRKAKRALAVIIQYLPPKQYLGQPKLFKIEK